MPAPNKKIDNSCTIILLFLYICQYKISHNTFCRDLGINLITSDVDPEISNYILKNKKIVKNMKKYASLSFLYGSNDLFLKAR